MAEQEDIQIAESEPAQPRSGRRRALRWTALVLVVLLGCLAGGWFRAWSDRGLTAAQADQATVRLTLDGFALGQSNGCDALGADVAVLDIPLHNYSPGPVQIRSITVNPPNQEPGLAQPTGVSIAAGGSAVVEALIPIQLCTASEATDCPTTEVELDATVAVIPESGRVHELKLPIAEWVPTQFLQLYEDAPFAAWGSTPSCP